MIRYTYKERTVIAYSDADVARTVNRLLADRGRALPYQAQGRLAVASMYREPRYTTVQLNEAVDTFMRGSC